MRRYATIIGALLILTSLGTIATADLGWDNPLAVFMIVPDEEWDLGSEINVTVHVFNEGDYYDPDEVNLSIGEEYRPINLTRVETGLYTGTFTVMEEDPDWEGDVYLEAEVTDDGGIWPDTASAYAWLWGSGSIGGDFSVVCKAIDPGNNIAAPGDTVLIGIWTSYAAESVDPDAGTLEVEVYDDYSDPVTYDLNRVEMGYYEVTFTIDSELDESGYYKVEVNATYSTGDDTYYYDDWVDVEVRLMEVWVHYVSVTPNSAEIEYFVMDSSGEPIEGATVAVEYSYVDEGWDYIAKDDIATTDELGMVTFILTYSNIAEDEPFLDIIIDIEADGMSESYDDYLFVGEDDVPPSEDGFNVAIDEEFLEADADITMDLVAWYDGDLMALQEVSMYVVTEEEILYHGMVRTDISGNFQLSFHTPSSGSGIMDVDLVEVHFSTHYLGYWERDTEWLLIGEMAGNDDIRDLLDGGTAITVEPFKAGETAEVTLTCTAADGVDEMAVVIWFAGSLDDLMETESSEWGVMGYWEPDTILGEVGATWSDGAYHASVPIPIFMDPEASLTFVGKVGFPSLYSDDIRAAFLEGVHVRPPNEPPTVAITFPVEGQQYSGTLMMEGSAGDDEAVESVEYRIDGSAWTEVEGTDTWSLEIDTNGLTPGTHQVEVRAYDGEEWSILDKVVFEVDQPPEISLTTPITGSLDGLWTFIGNAMDDNEVDKVEYRVDDGGWFTATGKDEWSFELDTTMFSSDDHVLWVRASDGERFSLEVDFDFTINQIPLVEITGNVQGKLFRDNVNFEGTASDDIAVVAVEIRIDSGEWLNISALTAWTYKAPTADMEEGNHSLEVRVWDGDKYSETEETYFEYEVSEEPGFGMLAALMAVMVAIPMARWRMRGRE